MLQHGPVGCQASRHFQLNVPKLPLPCEPLEYQKSFRFDRLLRTGGFAVSPKSDRHPRQSPVVAMAVPPAVVQSTNPADVSSSSTLGEVVVVGAGPAGCLLAHYLLRRGFFVHLFDKRAGAPSSPQHDGNGSDQQFYARRDPRSYNILLTSRAVKAFQGAGLEVPPNLLNQLVGSCTHLPNGKKRKFDYSNEPGLLSFGVSRNALVAWLQCSLHERYSNLKTYFEYELKSVDTTTNKASFRLSSKNFFSPKPDLVEVKYDLLVGADGVNSAVRSEMIHLDSTATSSFKKKSKPLELDFQPSSDVYKSFYVNPEVAKKSPLFEDHNRVQSWPAMNIIVTGMADGSFWGGSKNKQLMNASSAHEVEILLRGSAPELFELLLEDNPNFCEDFLKQPAISFGGAVTLSRFNHENILVIGDAAHAMFPSYGTGCNVALEDCLLLDQILEESIPVQGDISFVEVAKEFSKRRVEDAHAIVRMNTTQELFPRGFFGILQVMLFTSLRKLAPSIFKPIAYQQLWSDTRFRQIELQKRTENTLFFGMLLVLALLVIAALLFAFGIQPKFKISPS
ncbi:uncharacterized protein [Physcomitrium patens]|uniref:FAD-binding domain-containing protein n=1 Tax=Physcomitrium patens TaxID=3218 RepID=A0A7I4ADN8_PHYPA|nr:kynurenine 3-monooxygenase-like isoform X2 [Physcomitrium patens]|eukprot:XP_024389869.1 kynurenine 3-monooxygenase-like isoform X2 [Physcomitrella patens]